MMGSNAGHAVLPVAPGAVLVKVCGVVKEEDARGAVASGANLIGVIFAKSKRQASAEQAQAVVNVVRQFGERTSLVSRDLLVNDITARCGALRRSCKRTPLVVGVFMDQPLEEVAEKARLVGVDAVQLHGGEDVDFLKALR